MISKLIRKNILDLHPYSSARDEFQGQKALFLDANESPYGSYNRYPDPYQTTLRTKLAAIKKIPAHQIFIGNGSDEVIDLLLRIFCEPQKDRILICPPTYGMYEVAANIHNINTLKVPLRSDFQLDLQAVLKTIHTHDPKVIFLCSPNNPTGNALKEIEPIVKAAKGIVCLDEAYIDFSEQASFLSKLDTYPNLVISQTLSKARGLAGLRIGLAFASPYLISIFNRVKPPYNVSSLNQKEALKALQHPARFKRNLNQIKKNRTELLSTLQGLPLVEKVYPTDANFILIKVKNALALYTYLVNKRVIVRNRSQLVKNTLRISVGRAAENQKLIQELKNYEKTTVN